MRRNQWPRSPIVHAGHLRVRAWRPAGMERTNELTEARVATTTRSVQNGIREGTFAVVAGNLGRLAGWSVISFVSR